MNKFLNIIFRPSVAIILRKIVELNFRKEKEIIRKYFSVKKDDRVLDLGCGTGEFSPFFPAENYVGIDIDEANIDYAKAHYKRDFLIADAGKLPFGEQTFDKVLVIGVLHHLDDRACGQALSEIKRVLKPEGKVLIMEDTIGGPFLPSLINRLDRGAHIREKRDWINFFSVNFNIEMEQTFISGICFYSAFYLTNRAIF